MSLRDRALPSAGVRRRAIPALAVSATLLLAACTAPAEEEFSGAAGDVQAAVKSLADAAQADSYDRICERIFAPELAASLAATAGGDCPAAVKRAIDNADYTVLRVSDVDVTPKQDPTEAVATIDTVEDAGTREISLKLVGKQWRIAALDPKPAPTATTPAADGDKPASTTPAN